MTDLKIKIFADGASLDDIRKQNEDSRISGFTTNPTLMRKSGITDYKKFALEALDIVGNKPISFEVFSDDLGEMKRQALEIASWDKNNNIYIKIPITNTKGTSCIPLASYLSHSGVKINMTALFTTKQVLDSCYGLRYGAKSYISVFAGRLYDAGIDAVVVMQACREICNVDPNIELLWASPRMTRDIIVAEQCGCDIITCTKEILNKMHLLGKDPTEFSLDTVKMFEKDGRESGFTL